MAKQKRYYVAIALMLAAFATLGILSVYYYDRSKAYETSLKNVYTRAFHDMTDYLSDIDVGLKKMQLADDHTQLSTLSAQLYMQTEAAKACLGQLPQEDQRLLKVSGFLSQAGDYCKSLSRKVAQGGTVSEEEFKTLSSLSESAMGLSDGFSSATDESFYNGIRLSDTTQGFSVVYAEEMRLSDSLPQEYPTLIYDGPFSQHLENRKPELLKGKSDITRKDAQEIAQRFLESHRGKNLGFAEETHGDMETYRFSEEGDYGCEIEVTKQGGEVLWMLCDRVVDKRVLSMETAVFAAREFLESRGYKGFSNRYFDVADNIATINFAYRENDVTMYADLIKVKVALDNGEILGFEAKGYIMCHKNRTFFAPVITKEEAVSIACTRLLPDSVSVACIPLEGLREVLCYEVKGSLNGTNFLVYVNAETGQKEKILLLEESEHGILTV